MSACRRQVTPNDSASVISLRPPKRVLSSGGKRPRTAVDARRDGDDVNLVTTSASGELPNHPETCAAVEQASPETNVTLTPVKNQRASDHQPAPRRPRPNFLIFPW